MRSLKICNPTKYYLGDQIEKNEMGGACSAYGGKERHIQGLVGKADGKSPLGKPTCKWEDNIKMDVQEMG